MTATIWTVEGPQLTCPLATALAIMLAAPVGDYLVVVHAPRGEKLR